MYAASLWLSNSAYLYLSVSFIQMSKSLMPGLVYFSGILLGTERFSRATTANMALIAFGVAVCAYGEVNLPLKGVAQQLTALLFEARGTSSSQHRHIMDTALLPCQGWLLISLLSTQLLSIPFLHCSWVSISAHSRNPHPPPSKSCLWAA